MPSCRYGKRRPCLTKSTQSPTPPAHIHWNPGTQHSASKLDPKQPSICFFSTLRNNLRCGSILFRWQSLSFTPLENRSFLGGGEQGVRTIVSSRGETKEQTKRTKHVDLDHNDTTPAECSLFRLHGARYSCFSAQLAYKASIETKKTFWSCSFDCQQGVVLWTDPQRLCINNCNKGRTSR